MAALPGSIPDPSPPGRRHFPGRGHVSVRERPIRPLAAGLHTTYGRQLNSYHSLFQYKISKWKMFL
jgi:hypothetical protein